MNWKYNRWTNLTLGIVSVIAVSTLNSCKDDEEVVNPKLSFSSATKTVTEGEQNVKATITLDKPAPADLIVEYSLGGTAQRKIGTTIAGDYEIVGTSGEIEIAKGETTGAITLNILEDQAFEGNETIILSIEDVSNNVEITDASEMTITISGTDVSVTFAEAAGTHLESDLGTEVVVNLSKALTEDLVVEYDLNTWFDSQGNLVEGAAIDAASGEVEEVPEEYWDYGIAGTSGQLTIPAGETSAVIDVRFFPDFFLEDPETIELTLKASGGLTVGAIGKHTITLNQEDGMFVLLEWPETAGDAQADMDLFVRIGQTAENPTWNGILTASVYRDFEFAFEYVFIPSLTSGQVFGFPYTNTTLGFTYTYYDGTLNPLDFTASFIEFDAETAAFEPEANIDVYEGSYTSANINKWVSPNVPTQITQKITINNGVFGTPTALVIPGSGSRSSGPSFNMKKIHTMLKQVRPTHKTDLTTTPFRLK